MPPTILNFVEYFLPGFKAGGPIRTSANLVTLLGKDYRFKLVCHDRDLGDKTPYPGIPTLEWLPYEEAEIMYIPPSDFSARRLRLLVQETAPDLYYLHDVFDVFLILRMLILRLLRLIPDRPILIAAHGMFSAGALRIKWWKKCPYLIFLRASRIAQCVYWHASSELEKKDILKSLGQKAAARTFISLNTTFLSEGLAERHAKNPGIARLVFLARICRKKNLHTALRLLRKLRGTVVLDIFGPLQEPDYWKFCQTIIATLPQTVEVHYRGTLPPEDVPAAMRHYDFYYFPTDGENFGHTIIEALSSSVPVIISDQTPFDISAAKAGWSLPLADEAGLQNALQAAVDMDDETYQPLCHNAFALAMRIADKDERRREHIAMFEALIKGRASS